MQWRVGEINSSGPPRRYEIEPHWVSEELAAAGNTFHPPPQVCVTNHTYRVRARYQDNTGRWSHWSAPVQFVPAAAAAPPAKQSQP